MKAAVVLVVVVAAAVAIPVQWLELESAKSLQKGRLGDVYKNCSKSTDPLHIISLTLSPDPPEKGKNLAISVEYDLTEEVTGGEIKVNIKYESIIPYDKTFDICAELKTVNMTCPIKPVKSRFTISEEIPSDVPGGHYTGSVVATDQKGQELACFDLDFHL
jgi:hypothetical protein